MTREPSNFCSMTHSPRRGCVGRVDTGLGANGMGTPPTFAFTSLHSDNLRPW
jgi:hypothetical protein